MIRMCRAASAVAVLLVVSACGVEGRPTGQEQLASCRGGEVPFEASALTAPPLEDGDHPALPQIKKELQPRGHLRAAEGAAETKEIRLLSDADGRAVFAFGDTSDISK